MNTYRFRVRHISSEMAAIVEVQSTTERAAAVAVEQLLVYGGDGADFDITNEHSQDSRCAVCGAPSTRGKA